MNRMGVTNLSISHDDFHSKFIKTDYIKYFNRSRKYPDIQITVNIAVSKNSTGDKIIHDLGEAILEYL